MRSRRSVAIAAFVFVLTFSSLAHAETASVPINDPVTDTLQLWSEIIDPVEAVAHELATALIPNSQSPAPNGTTQPPDPATFAAAAAESKGNVI